MLSIILISDLNTQVPNVRLACARVVAALPESYRASCVDLVETAQAQLREDKDPDVRAVMRGEGEEEPVSCDTIIPTFTSLDNVISEVDTDTRVMTMSISFHRLQRF